jgi:hypothetical protein
MSYNNGRFWFLCETMAVEWNEWGCSVISLCVPMCDLPSCLHFGES